jgi:hypothetical protein
MTINWDEVKRKANERGKATQVNFQPAVPSLPKAQPKPTPQLTAVQSRRGNLPGGNLPTAKTNVLEEAFDKNENYIDKFKKGNIGGGVANVVGTGLTAGATIYRNILNSADSLSMGKGLPKFQPQMSFKDYDKSVADRRGALPVGEQISDKNKLLGEVFNTAMEIGSDPLELTPLGYANDIKLAKGFKPNTASYMAALQTGKLNPAGVAATLPRATTPAPQPRVLPIVKKAPVQAQPQTLPRATESTVQPRNPNLGAEIPREQMFSKNGDLPKAENVAPDDAIIEKIKNQHKDDGTVADVLTDSKQLNKGISEKASETVGFLKRKFVDSGDAVSKIAKKTGDNKLYAYYNNARIAKRRAENMIGEAQTNITGQRIGKSLKEIVDPVRKKGDGYYKDFQKYLLHEHNVDRMAQGKPVFGETVTAEMSRAEADNLLRENPEFAELAQEIYNFNKNNMQYRIDSGLVTQEQADLWNAMYPHYVPTFRANPKTKGMMASKNMAAVEQTIKKAKGGNSDILPLHENLSKQTMQTVEAAHKNIFGNRLVNNASDQTSEYIQDIKNVAEDLDLDAELPELKNHFRVYRDGKAYEVKVDDGLFEGLQALSDTGAQSSVGRVITAGNTGFKQLITGFNPMFLVRNFARDIQDTGLYSKDLGKFAKKYPQAIKEMSTNSEAWQQYKALGGAGNSFFDYAKGYKNDPSWLRANTLDRVEQLNMAVEQLPRFTEFLATKGNGTYDELMQAMYNAADVTVNFGRSGAWGKTINRTFVPFFNPAMQGTDKIVRKFAETKGVKEWTELVLKVGALGVAPSLINEMVYQNDPQYEMINDREKDINYIFKIGDGEFVKVPKGRVLSMFGSAAQRGLRLANGQKDAFAGYIKTMSDQVAPINPLTSNIAAPLLAVGTNQSWFGGRIEPQRLEKYSPGLRFDESTTELSKAIGGVLNYSPKKIDYLLDAYSGVIGDFAIPLTTPRAERNPFVKAFTIDSVTSNEISQKFYDKLEETKYAKNDVEGEDENDILNRYMNKQSDVVSDLYNEIRAVENGLGTDKVKRDKVREIKAIINGIEQTALDTLPEVEKTTENLSKRYKDPDDLYREVNKKVFGAKYALQVYDRRLYDKAVASQIGFDKYYDSYFAQKDYPSDVGKALALESKNLNTYKVFGVSDKNANMAKAIKASGLSETYNKTYAGLKGVTGSEDKMNIINQSNPGLTREQLVLLYEVFDISQGTGKYTRQF